MDLKFYTWRCPVCENVMNPFTSTCPHCMADSGGLLSASTELTKEWEELINNGNIKTETS